MGASLTCEDFYGDSYDDLFIGSPWAMVDGVPQSGRVYEIPGSLSGLIPDGQAARNRAAPQEFQQFGLALNAGELNSDGFDDAVFGMPFEDVDGNADAGRVDIFFGTADGLTDAGFQALDESQEPLASISDRSQTDDLIGYGAAVGIFNLDGFDDLMHAVPGQDLNGSAEAGAFRVLYGTTDGVTNQLSRLFGHEPPLPGAQPWRPPGLRPHPPP